MVSRVKVLGEHLHIVHCEPRTVLRTCLCVHVRSELPRKPENRTRVHVEQTLLPVCLLVRAILEKSEDANCQDCLLWKVLHSHGCDFWAIGRDQCRLAIRSHDNIVDDKWQALGSSARHRFALQLVTALTHSLHLPLRTFDTALPPTAVTVAPRLFKPQGAFCGCSVACDLGTFAMGALCIALPPAAVSLPPLEVLLIDPTLDQSVGQVRKH
mmetsp:Transcript_128448/g.410761  ORF Transcript_128448/g.410761 Transcript_128448/m.410761 type:complete len:212 (-) Transcript_128448:248-883(-)